MTDTAATAAGPTANEPSPGYRAYILSMLIIVYTFNFIDRQILSILMIPIQEEFKVEDWQVGLMRGLAFALFYSVLGVPIAWLADRTNRVWIMTIALTLWSAMTAVCGLAQNAMQLFFARMAVGVGEAGGVAPAYSLISDYFPPAKRARALAIYSFGIPIGSALGIIFAGIIATILDWRAAFLILGLAGVAFAPFFWFTVREPRRGAFDKPGALTAAVPISAVVKTLSRKPSFWLLSVGAASSSMMGYGLFAWMPAFFERSYDEELRVFFAWGQGWLIPSDAPALLYAAYFYGAIVLVGGVAGIWLGGFLGDRLGEKDRAAYATVPAVAFLATLPFFIIGVLAGNLWLKFFVFLIPTALSLAWLGPVLAAFQHIVPPNMRATASAIFLLINNLIGIGVGDVALGGMSSYLKPIYGDDSLRYSILAGTVFYVVASLLLFWAARYLKRDWEE